MKRICLVSVLIVTAACESPGASDPNAVDLERAATSDEDLSEASLEDGFSSQALDTETDIPQRDPDAAMTPQDGLVRPGGPASKPVPGSAGETWSWLNADDIAGTWLLRTETTALGCRLLLGAVNASGSGTVTFEGACPFTEAELRRWRHDDRLGQVFLLDGAGKITVRLMQSGPKRFRAFQPDGWIYFDPEDA